MKYYEVRTLNKRITIQKRTLTKDSASNEIEQWQDYYTCYAGTPDAKTEVGTESGEQQSSQKVTFIMRDCQKLHDMMFNTKQYRIVFRDYRFRILTADNFGYTQDKFKISAVIDDERQ